jgi:hypothetical protein
MSAMALIDPRRADREAAAKRRRAHRDLLAQESGAEPMDRAAALRAIAAERSEEVWTERLVALRDATRWQRAHLVLGVGVVVFGTVAGTAAVTEATPALTGIAAFVAAAFGGIQGFLSPQREAERQWTRGAGLGALSQRWELLEHGGIDATPQELEACLERWEQLHAVRS